MCEKYLIVPPPHHLLESRRSYFTKPYFCDVPRNIRLPLWSDHDIAGPHRIIDKRKLDIKRITTDYWTIELKGIHFI